MIDYPSEDELANLRAYGNPHCLTMYVPFIDPNYATNPTRIEYKNMLREAEEALVSSGVDEKAIKKILKPLRALMDGGEFWPPKHESLAIFADKDFFHCYHVPEDTVPHMLTVGKGFNLEPLEKAIRDEGNENYYVLALSHKHVKLYKGDKYRLEPVDLTNFPTEMKGTLNIDEYPHSRQSHTISPSGKGSLRSAQGGSKGYHDHSEVANTDKEMLLEFFHRIDKFLHKIFNKDKSPLIIGGVEYLLPIYRKANTYPGLLEETIVGNLDRANLPFIREKAWALLKGEASAAD